MRRKRLMLGLVVLECLVLAAGAVGAGARAADALNLHGVFSLSISAVSCPNGSPQLPCATRCMETRPGPAQEACSHSVAPT